MFTLIGEDKKLTSSGFKSDETHCTVNVPFAGQDVKQDQRSTDPKGFIQLISRS